MEENGKRKEERVNETSEEREERKDKRNEKQKEKSKEERQILVDRKNASIARERAEPTIMNEIVKDDLYDLHSGQCVDVEYDCQLDAASPPPRAKGRGGSDSTGG